MRGRGKLEVRCEVLLWMYSAGICFKKESNLKVSGLETIS
jgi:hypothetical protein